VEGITAAWQRLSVDALKAVGTFIRRSSVEGKRFFNCIGQVMIAHESEVLSYLLIAWGGGSKSLSASDPANCPSGQMTKSHRRLLDHSLQFSTPL
jgi:hypothetical protein